MSTLDPSLIRVESAQMTVDSIIKGMAEGTILHRHEWNTTTPSEHAWRIEGVLLKLPLKPLLFSQRPGARANADIVIDGRNRHDLACIREYLFGEFRLFELRYFPEHEGHFFLDLPRRLQRRILETQWMIYRFEHLQENTDIYCDINSRFTNW